jgi:YteA family regulatory protein
MRKEVEESLQGTGQFGLDDPMSDELSELSMYDNHPADIASELFEREKDVALRDNAKLRLQAIDRAIEALDNGTYGTCAGCGQAIPQARMEANPLATRCVNCQRAVEAEHPDRDRPIEEAFLWPGYGRTDTDDEDSVLFDGEDAWQAVERFNERPEYGHAYEQIFLDDNEGLVDEIDIVSNEDYKRQLP